MWRGIGVWIRNHTFSDTWPNYIGLVWLCKILDSIIFISSFVHKFTFNLIARHMGKKIYSCTLWHCEKARVRDRDHKRCRKKRLDKFGNWGKKDFIISHKFNQHSLTAFYTISFIRLTNETNYYYSRFQFFPPSIPYTEFLEKSLTLRYKLIVIRRNSNNKINYCGSSFE